MVECLIKPNVEISSPKQERCVPEYNLLEQKFNRFFYMIGRVTHPSIAVRKKEMPEEGIERSLLTRAVRADLLRRLEAIPKSDKETRKQIFKEAHDRDEIAKRYLNQGEITINLSSLGEQKARYVVIEPPSQETSETKTQPTIFLIPAWSNDIDPVGSLVQELAFSGRRVITVGYPESSLGKITKEYADNASQSSNYEPQSSFFKEAVKHFASQYGQIELWGFSTGGPIAAEMLIDSGFQKLITNAVLLAPAGSVTQLALQLITGIGREVGLCLTKFGKLAKYSLASPVVRNRKIPKDPEQEELKKRVSNNLLSKICRKEDVWPNLRVQEGGRIIIWSGGRDQITKSSRAKEDFEQNPQISIISDPEGSHATPLLDPHYVIQQVFEKQKSYRWPA